MLNNERLTVKIAGGDAMDFRMTNITSTEMHGEFWVKAKKESNAQPSFRYCHTEMKMSEITTIIR